MATTTCYHGTRSQFDRLAAGQPTQLPSAGLLWLSESRRHAETYARYSEGDGPSRVLTCEVTYDRPFDVSTDDDARALYDAWCAERDASGEAVVSAGDAPLGYDTDGWPHYDNNPWLAVAARESGYDAILTTDGNGEVGIGIYDPAQVVIVAESVLAES